MSLPTYSLKKAVSLKHNFSPPSVNATAILLDINNIAVNSINFEAGNVNQSVHEYIHQLPLDRVAQIHLAGCTSPADGELMIDDHACPVSDAVWQGYEQALQRFGALPTLIEWDNNLPEWSALIDEAHKARRLYNAVLKLRREVENEYE